VISNVLPPPPPLGAQRMGFERATVSLERPSTSNAFLRLTTLTMPTGAVLLPRGDRLWSDRLPSAPRVTPLTRADLMRQVPTKSGALAADKGAKGR
jgi:hypothetical protein